MKNISHIVTHNNCADGIASALVLNQVFPDARVSFLNYGEEAHRNLVPEEGMIFCDFSPFIPQEEQNVEEYLKPFVDLEVIVLDHHESQEKAVKAFGEFGVYASDAGVSGAVLAYDIIWRGHNGYIEDEHIRDFVELIGIRDTWVEKDPRFGLSSEITMALKFLGFEELHRTHPHEWMEKLEIGKILQRNHDKKIEDFIKNGLFKKSARGTSYFIAQGLSQTSDAAQILRAGAFPVDLIVGFSYLSKPEMTLQFSTRSTKGGYPCHELAKFFGGGGHQPAAGFSIPEGQYSPFVEFSRRLDEFESR